MYILFIFLKVGMMDAICKNNDAKSIAKQVLYNDTAIEHSTLCSGI
jgi:hypothetical protein